MNTWRDYYEEHQRRMNLLDEAKQYRLIAAGINLKESGVRKSPFRIHLKIFQKINGVSFETK